MLSRAIGVRSQLYLIAKRGPEIDKCVCIAGAHQQFFEAMPMILALRHLLDTLVNVTNARLLSAESRALRKLVESSDDLYVVHRFACELLVNASSNFRYLSGATTDSFTQAQNLPGSWIQDPSSVDNDNGILVVDVSVPTKPRYCFILFCAEDDSKTFTPLDAATYYEGSYYQNEMVKDPEYKDKWKNVLENIDKYATLSAAEVKATWPELEINGSQDEENAQMPSDTEKKEEPSSALSLKARTIEEALKRPDQEEYVMKREDAETLIWEYTLDNPHKLTKTVLSNLLKTGRTTLTRLDLSGLSSFNSDDSFQVLSGHLHAVEWLSICGLDQVTDDGLKILALAANLEELVMFGCEKVTGRCFESLKEACPKLKYVYRDFPTNIVIEYDSRYRKDSDEEAAKISKKIVCGRYHQVYCLVPETIFYQHSILSQEKVAFSESFRLSVTFGR